MIYLLCILSDAFFIALMIWFAITDLRTRTVSNVAALLLLGLGLAHMVLVLLLNGTWWTYPAGLLLSLPFFIVWLKGDIGAGDVKLLMGIGLYLGLWNTLAAFVPMFFATAVWVICLRVKGRSTRSSIPFAPVIVFGAGGIVLLRYVITFLYR